MVIAYNPRVVLGADFEKAKTGAMPWYKVLAKPGIKFLRADPLLDKIRKVGILSIATRLADILYHNSELELRHIKRGRKEQQPIAPRRDFADIARTRRS